MIEIGKFNGTSDLFKITCNIIYMLFMPLNSNFLIGRSLIMLLVYLQCEDFSPFWIEGFVHGLSL